MKFIKEISKWKKAQEEEKEERRRDRKKEGNCWQLSWHRHALSCLTSISVGLSSSLDLASPVSQPQSASVKRCVPAGHLHIYTLRRTVWNVYTPQPPLSLTPLQCTPLHCFSLTGAAMLRFNACQLAQRLPKCNLHKERKSALKCLNKTESS